MKPFQHEVMSTLHLQLSRANIHLCHGATSTLYLHWSCANICLFHDIASTLYLHWSRANIRLFHDIALTLHLHWSRTNIGLYNGAALAPIFRGNKVQTSRVHSTVARHQDFRDRKCKDFSLWFRRCQWNLEVSRRMPPRLWHCKELSLRPWRCEKNAAKTLTLHGHALRGEMMQHQLQMLEEGDVV